MGFYGNITNTSKTQFQFDRTYPNRATMEANLTTDGIYTGRYVLIEYDTDLSKTLDTFMRVYMKEGVAYTTADFSDVSKLKKKDIGLGDIVFTSNDYIAGQPLVPTDCVFWKCTSNLDENSSEPATFARVVSSESNYVMNFNIDTAKYGESRGYDSTVWQKVYVNNIEKYVQIAELNSVVPTFDISADAPTIHPIQPHFDINSTNVYYKLHWQPQWGFRAKEAKLGNKTMSNDKNNYPSDEKIQYDIFSYDSDTGTTNSSTVEYDAAIYYNKLGFDKTIRTKVPGEDHIQVLPTGISGTSYNTHSLTEESSNNTQADIQEFQILLPSLGNTISDIWDLIYGYGKKILPDETYDPNIPSSNQNRFKNIEWKDAKDDSTEGMTRDLGTLAGCINKVHDLIGMIITNKSDSELNEEGFNNNYIYRDNDNKYYRIHKYPTYTTSTVEELNLPKRNQFNSDQEYNTAYEIAILDKLSDNQYYLIIDGSSSNKQVETLNKKSLSALNDTDIIGYQNGYGYEYVLIPDMPGKMATIYGLILKIKNLLEVEDFETRDTSTVIGSINTLNDIIDVFEDLVPGEFLICDSNGHVNSANWTTAQDFSYTNYNSNNPSAVSKPFNTEENRWISLSLDEENRNIELKHIFNKIEDTTTTANKNNASIGDGINKSTDDTLKLYTPIVDAMGHVVGKNVETVTLPYSFKKITTNGEVNSIVTDMAPTAGTSIADNTQDEFTINVGNKWLHAAMDVNADTLTLAHEVNAITITAKTATDLNNGTDTITIQDIQHDAAGHIIANQNHTYTLPFGYKTFKDSNTEKVGISTASNTQDTFVFKGDSWIQPTITEDKVTFTHSPATGSSIPKDNIENTQFGSTFTIEDWHFDDKGHKYGLTTHEVQFPKGSLNAAAPNESDVVLQIKLTPESGAIETQRVNIATLKLASYTKETDSTDIVASDTLGKALSKLQTQIIKEKTRIDNLDLDESAAAGSYISSIKQVDGQVSFGTTQLPSVTDSSEEGKYVSSVSEINGKISVTKTILPTYSLNTGTTNGTVSFNGVDVSVYGLGSAAYTNKETYAPSNILDTTFTYGDESKTIAQLFEIVNDLAIQINTLSQELNALKNKVETEHPTSTDETTGT